MLLGQYLLGIKVVVFLMQQEQYFHSSKLMEDIYI